MASSIIGTCSKCGGPVVMPSMMVDPVPYCKHCGAKALHRYGPVVPMERVEYAPETDKAVQKVLTLVDRNRQ